MTSRKWIVLTCLLALSTLSQAHSSRAQGTTPKEQLWQAIAPYFSPPTEYQGDYGAYRSPLKFYDGRTVKTPEDWKKRREEILERWHTMMGKWPPLITKPNVEILETEYRENFTQHRVRFNWLPDEKTEGYLLIPDGEGKKPAVLTVFYEPETAIGKGIAYRDFAYQLAKRGFVTLSIGTTETSKAKTYSLYYPDIKKATVQPLSMLGYAAANAWYVLASRPEVDQDRIGVIGHSYGGKWAMFASCLFDKFACAVWSDPGIIFDDSRKAVNYWEPWYLGYEQGRWRKRGIITPENPTQGLYPKLRAQGYDLHELHALMAPRPFLVSGGSEDPPRRWVPLNHTIAVNNLLGVKNRVAMTNRPAHSPTDESNDQVYKFFEYFLKSDSQASKPVRPLQTMVDLNVGQQKTVTLCDGSTATVKLLDVQETRDTLRGCIREAEVTVEIDGKKVTLPSALYHLPVTVGKVQVDCTVTKGYPKGNVYNKQVWALDADARLRLWPAGSPWIRPESFVYPVRQRWFATDTQMANELAYVDGGDHPSRSRFYYHYGLDFGGFEGEVDVVAASSGVVVGVGEEVARSESPMPLVVPSYARIHIRDDRGWYQRYCHLHSIDPSVKLGQRVEKGQKIATLGKEGTSGGWAHLHFDIMAPLGDGRYAIVDPYAFCWQAYHSKWKTKLQAVARPHHLAAVGEAVTLDGSRSHSFTDPASPLIYEWILSDGSTAKGEKVTTRYGKPGTYSEVLKVTDAAGRVDYDFSVVQVLDPTKPKNFPPAIHAASFPTRDIKVGDPVRFAVRSFRVDATEGVERWDFGDGSSPVEVRSDGNAVILAKDGYARTTHRYEKPGDYLVKVSRTNHRGETATAHLFVRVGSKTP